MKKRSGCFREKRLHGTSVITMSDSTFENDMGLCESHDLTVQARYKVLCIFDSSITDDCFVDDLQMYAFFLRDNYCFNVISDEGFIHRCLSSQVIITSVVTRMWGASYLEKNNKISNSNSKSMVKSKA